jgi:nicotinate-nucleotide adenylyltransferase
VAGVRPRLGVLGGSFDPPHLGHLVIASEACARLDLERVLFVPAAAPPHKDPGQRTAASARLTMTRLAVEHDPRFEVLGVEMERDLVYTRDTVRAVADRFPDHDLIFIMGSDSLLQLETWHDPETILGICTLAVALRPGDDPEAVVAAAERWGTGRARLIEAPLVGISSSAVRARVAAGLPIRYLVTSTVEEFVRQHGLYLHP